MVSRSWLVLVILSIALCGCKKDSALGAPDGAWQYSSYLSDEWREAFSRVKKLPTKADDKSDALYQEFKSETSAVDALMANQLANDKEFKLRLVEMRNKVVLNHYLTDVVAKSVTDEMVKEYYDKHQQEFSRTEYQLAQIVIPGDSVESASEILKAIDQELKAGKSFSDVAATYSQDTVSRQKGGDIGWIADQNLTQAERDAIKAIQVGGATSPVVIGNEIKIYALQSGQKITVDVFNQVKDSAKYKLVKSLQEEERNKLLGKVGA